MPVQFKKQCATDSVPIDSERYGQLVKNCYDVTSGENENGNFVVSPLGIFEAMALLVPGAKGETSEVLNKALGLSNDRNVAVNTCAKLSRDLTTVRDRNGPVVPEETRCDGQFDERNEERTEKRKVFFSIFLGAFLDENFPVQEDYVNTITKLLSAECRKLNFHYKGQTVNEINNFVKKTTRNKITEFINEDDIVEPYTKFFLISTIYFDGKWESKFDADDNEILPFYSNGNKNPSMTTFMIQYGCFAHQYLPKCDATGLTLPYVDGNFVMVFLIPNEIDGFEKLRDNFNAEDIRTVANAPVNRDEDVKIEIPKFNIQTLARLDGIWDVFGIGGELRSGNYENFCVGGTHLTKMFQKAIVEVNENGTVAAAATGECCDGCEEFDTTISANRPFIFAIYHKKEKMVLFLGQMKKIC